MTNGTSRFNVFESAHRHFFAKAFRLPLTSRNHPLCDLQLVQFLCGITSLSKINALKVLVCQIVFAIKERRYFLMHQVEDVESGTEVAKRSGNDERPSAAWEG